MNRRQFLRAAPATAAALAAGCTLAGGRTALRVLTYNLHHGEGVDGRVDLERIARIIRECRADVVALQEVDVSTERTGRVDQAAEYLRLTGMHGNFGKAIDFQGGAYGMMLLSRWPLADFTVHRLPNPSKREQRLAVSARISPPGRPAFRFIGTHLDASREDGDRWLQAGRLQDLFANDLVPAIMAGDFNDRPESRVMTRMLSLWQDAAADRPEPTIPADRPNDRIDFVLVRPPGAWRVVRTQVLPESTASDHRPVLAELTARR